MFWIERFIRFHALRHPDTMGTAEVQAFLTHLAVEGHVAASTQNQALAALLFLYQGVLQRLVGTGAPPVLKHQPGHHADPPAGNL